MFLGRCAFRAIIKGRLFLWKQSLPLNVSGGGGGGGGGGGVLQ